MAIIRSSITPFIPSLILFILDLKNFKVIENFILTKTLKQCNSVEKDIVHILIGVEPIDVYIFKILLRWMAKRMCRLTCGSLQNHYNILNEFKYLHDYCIKTLGNPFGFRSFHNILKYYQTASLFRIARFLKNEYNLNDIINPLVNLFKKCYNTYIIKYKKFTKLSLCITKELDYNHFDDLINKLNYKRFEQYIYDLEFAVMNTLIKNISKSKSPLKFFIKKLYENKYKFYYEFTNKYKTQYQFLKSNFKEFLDWSNLGLYYKYSKCPYFIYILQYIIPNEWNKIQFFNMKFNILITIITGICDWSWREDIKNNCPYCKDYITYNKAIHIIYCCKTIEEFYNNHNINKNKYLNYMHEDNNSIYKFKENINILKYHIFPGYDKITVWELVELLYKIDIERKLNAWNHYDANKPKLNIFADGKSGIINNIINNY